MAAGAGTGTGAGADTDPGAAVTAPAPASATGIAQARRPAPRAPQIVAARADVLAALLVRSRRIVHCHCAGYGGFPQEKHRHRAQERQVSHL